MNKCKWIWNFCILVIIFKTIEDFPCSSEDSNCERKVEGRKCEFDLFDSIQLIIR